MVAAVGSKRMFFEFCRVSIHILHMTLIRVKMLKVMLGNPLGKETCKELRIVTTHNVLDFNRRLGSNR